MHDRPNVAFECLSVPFQELIDISKHPNLPWFPMKKGIIKYLNGYLKNIHSDESGYILQVVMTFFFIMTILGITILHMASQEGIQTIRFEQRAKALYQAQGGVKKAIWRINHVGKGGGTFSIPEHTVFFDSTSKIITATGYSGSIDRSIEVRLERDHPFRHIISYENMTTGWGTITICTDGHGTQWYEDFPAADFNYWDTIADYHYTGSQVFQNIVPSGIHYVDGDVTFGNASLINGTVVATGNVKLSGNAVISSAKIPGNETYFPAIVSGDSVYSQSEGFLSGVAVFGAIFAASFIELKTNYSSGPLVAPDISLKSLTLIWDMGKRKYYSYPPGFESPENKDWYEIEKYGTWRMIN